MSFDMHAIGQARNIISGARIEGDERIYGHAFELLQVRRPGRGLIERIRRHQRRYWQPIGHRGAAHVGVIPGMVIADSEDEVLLARVGDRVRPSLHRREPVQFVGTGGIGPLRHIAHILVVADGGVIEDAHLVIQFVVMPGFAEAVQEIHIAALRHTARRSGNRVGVREHDAGAAIPFSSGVGNHRRGERLRIRRADEAHRFAQYAALPDGPVGIEIREGTEANFVRVLLQQAFRLVVSAVLRAIGFEERGSETRRGIANLDADVDPVGAGGRPRRGICGCRAGQVLYRPRRRRIGVRDPVAREHHHVAVARDPQIKRGPGAEGRGMGDSHGGHLISGRLTRSPIRIVSRAALTRAPGFLEDRFTRRIDAAVAARQRPTKGIDGLHRRPVHEIAAPLPRAGVTERAGRESAGLEVAARWRARVVNVVVAFPRIEIA